MILEDRTWKSWQTSLPCNAQRYLRICRLEPDGWSTDCIDQPSAWTPNTTNLRKTTKGILEWKFQFSLQSSIHFFPSQFWEFGVTLSWWLCLFWSPVCLTMYSFFEGKKIECSWSQEEIELGSRQQNLMASGFQVSCQATLLLYVIIRHDDVSSYFRSIQECPRDLLTRREELRNLFELSCKVWRNQENILKLIHSFKA